MARENKILVFLCAICTISFFVGYYSGKLNCIHEVEVMAEECRPIIIQIPGGGIQEEAKEVTEEEWWTEEELELLAKVVYCEAGSDEITDRHQQLVAQVVINRVKDERFPNTITDVIYAPNQYSCVGNSRWNSGEIPERCYENALCALRGEVECPKEVVYQANFKQGYEVYEIYDMSYSTTYFCKG